MKLWLAQDEEADKLLAEDPLALLIGMVLDQQIPLEKAFHGPKVIYERILKRIDLGQQIPMEVAFAGPKKIADRIGGIDAHQIAEYDPEAFVALCSERPAIHRFPGSMARRVQVLAQEIVDEYDGRAENIWKAGDPDGAQLLKRLKALPGFGEQKAKIFVALLGKQYGVQPKDWRKAAGNYGEKDTHLSVADVVDAESLGLVRAHKKEMKAAAKAKAAKA